jgi:hypothetical protein
LNYSLVVVERDVWFRHRALLVGRAGLKPRRSSLEVPLGLSRALPGDELSILQGTLY